MILVAWNGRRHANWKRTIMVQLRQLGKKRFKTFDPERYRPTDRQIFLAKHML